MDNKQKGMIVELLKEAFNLDKAIYVDSNIFERKFKNLLAFNLLLAGLTTSHKIIFMDINKDYVLSKYKKYINDYNNENKIMDYAISVKKLNRADVMINGYESIFGKDSFYDISEEPNYEQGLHENLRTQIFDVYINNTFPESRKYKIWKLFNQPNP